MYLQTRLPAQRERHIRHCALLSVPTSSYIRATYSSSRLTSPAKSPRVTSTDPPDNVNLGRTLHQGPLAGPTGSHRQDCLFARQAVQSLAVSHGHVAGRAVPRGAVGAVREVVDRVGGHGQGVGEGGGGMYPLHCCVQRVRGRGRGRRRGDSCTELTGSPTSSACIWALRRTSWRSRYTCL